MPEPGVLRILLVLVVAFLIGTPSTASAEPVRVERTNSEVGHGWLFRAPNDRQSNDCWIALPSHVAGWRPSSGTEPKLHSFEFITQSGERGEAGIPLAIAEVPAAQTHLPASADLAFAQVKSGGPVAGCKSRLGPDPLSYRVIHNDDDAVFTARSMGRGSLGIYRFRPGLRESGQNPWRVRLRAVSDTDRDSLILGISGAVALFDVIGTARPYAMIFSVKGDNAIAIRFDTIQKAFPAVRAALAGTRTLAPSEGTSPNGHRFDIVGYTGIKSGKGAGPSALLSDDGCWVARAPKNEKVIRVAFDPEGTVRIRALRLQTRPECVPPGGEPGPVSVGIDTSFDAGKTWERVSDCSLEMNGIETACRVARGGGNRDFLIRATFSAKQIAVSRARLERRD